MSRQLQQVLEQLIPRHSGAFPPELVALASSLLAQSRSQLSTLKAEEESSRTYICANIACERSKTTLNLPKIEPRPPLPPKVYKKLYELFDRTLASASSRKRGRPSNAKAPERVLPQRHVPSKEKGLQNFRTNRTPKQGMRFGSNKKNEKLEKWIGPSIRYLCKGFESNSRWINAIPHVYAGIESILFLPCPQIESGDNESGMEGKIPALLVAVLLYVMALISGRPLHQFSYDRYRDRLLPWVNGLRENPDVITKVGNGEEGWENWEEVTISDIDKWRDEIATRGWTDMEWCKNIMSGKDVRVTDEEDARSSDDEDTDDSSGEESLSKRKDRISHDPGLGRMEPEIYLQKDYSRWKSMMLAKIDALEKDERTGMD